MTAIAIFVLVIVLITLAELSKKPLLQKQVPLHPSTLITPPAPLSTNWDCSPNLHSETLPQPLP